MNKLKVYLAGWSKELEYRKYCKENYSTCLDLIDPMEQLHDDIKENIGNNCYKEFIVRHDKKLILSCDVLVAYVRVGPTWGTCMEMMFAFDNGIPIYMIDPHNIFRYDSWVEPHIKRAFDNIDDCCRYLYGIWE